MSTLPLTTDTAIYLKLWQQPVQGAFPEYAEYIRGDRLNLTADFLRCAGMTPVVYGVWEAFNFQFWHMEAAVWTRIGLGEPLDGKKLFAYFQDPITGDMVEAYELSRAGVAGEDKASLTHRHDNVTPPGLYRVDIVFEKSTNMETVLATGHYQILAAVPRA